MWVGDMKYKRVNVKGIKHPDLYQMLAYTVATELPSGLLVYAAGEGEPLEHQVVHMGKSLDVATLEVTGSPDEILGEVEALAARIVSSRWSVDSAA